MIFSRRAATNWNSIIMLIIGVGVIALGGFFLIQSGIIGDISLPSFGGGGGGRGGRGGGTSSGGDSAGGPAGLIVGVLILLGFGYYLVNRKPAEQRSERESEERREEREERREERERQRERRREELERERQEREERERRRREEEGDDEPEPEPEPEPAPAGEDEELNEKFAYLKEKFAEFDIDISDEDLEELLKKLHEKEKEFDELEEFLLEKLTNKKQWEELIEGSDALNKRIVELINDLEGIVEDQKTANKEDVKKFREKIQKIGERLEKLNDIFT